MRKKTEKFFGRFEAQEKTVHKSVAMSGAQWRLIEAYKLYGCTKKGHDIPIQRLIREILLNHVENQSDFFVKRDEWLDKLQKIEAAAKEVNL